MSFLLAVARGARRGQSSLTAQGADIRTLRPTSPPFVAVFGMHTRQSSTLSYQERKDAAKQKRREKWAKKMERQEALKTRRVGRNRFMKKKAFMNYFAPLRKQQQFEDREARRVGLPWKIKVAAIVERLPIVLPDSPRWERDYLDLKAYLDSFGKVFPKEFNFPEHEDYRPDMTNEELLEKLLPEGFTPGPRETEADITGEVKTLDRQLKTRIFLTLKEEDDWKFPTATAMEEETLLDAAKRALSDAVGTNLVLYCPSNCPMAVDMRVFSDEERNMGSNAGFYGEKIFYFRVQRHEGDVKENAITANDYGWLAKDEILKRVKEQKGEDSSNFFHFLL